ncbi:IS30 family transposase [Streptomyces sp. NPDC088847]|uniref:IS30 family transposase n=1 Tax=Streptomyces sp. NPDC088847 TaxID=3365909 RepID=UPI0037F73887
MSLLERRRVASLRGRGLTIREMAGLLGRAPSTVSRELRRNSRPHDYGRYDADLAHHRGRERAGRPRRSKLSTDAELKAEVQSKLNMEWSPEQIAAHLRTRWPDRPERRLCHETIYRALYQGAKGCLSRTLTRKLRAGRPLRKQRRRRDQRIPRFVAPAVPIDRRPLVIELRERLGGWRRPRRRRQQSVRRRHARRPTNPIPPPGPAVRGTLRPPASRRSDSHSQHTAGTSTPESHLGPELRDGPPSRIRALLHQRHLLRMPQHPQEPPRHPHQLQIPRPPTKRGQSHPTPLRARSIRRRVPLRGTRVRSPPIVTTAILTVERRRQGELLSYDKSALHAGN